MTCAPRDVLSNGAAIMATSIVPRRIFITFPGGVRSRAFASMVPQTRDSYMVLRQRFSLGFSARRRQP